MNIVMIKSSNIVVVKEGLAVGLIKDLNIKFAPDKIHPTVTFVKNNCVHSAVANIALDNDQLKIFLAEPVLVSKRSQ